MKYDLVINAKKIITMDESNPTATWVAVNQGKIAAIGSGCPVPEGVSVLNLPDSTIVTGLIDSHIPLRFPLSRPAPLILSMQRVRLRSWNWWRNAVLPLRMI